MTRKPQAYRQSEVQDEKYGPVVMGVTWAFITIIGLLFVGFVIGTGIRMALLFWPR